MSFLGALLVSALAGFIALSYEMVWFRAYAFVSGSSPGAFGHLLGAYLLGVAFGSVAAGVVCDARGAGAARRLPAVAAFALAANALGYLVVPRMASLAVELEWPLAIRWVALASGAMGATFPLVSHLAVRPDERAGARVAELYMANIVGSCAGSLLTGYVLFDVWPLARVSLFLALAGCGLAALVLGLAELPYRRRALGWAAIVGAAWIAVLFGPRLYDRVYERLQLKDAFTEESRFLEIVENRHGVLAVTRDKHVWGGGEYDGTFSVSLVDDKNALVRAFAIGALHPSPREVLLVGLASGAWTQAIAHLPGVERVTVVEINPAGLSLIPKHPEVAGILTNPKVTIEIDDARRWLRRHPDRQFDAVVSNTTFHWRAHISSLLSKEYFELVRAHLKPGGIFHTNTTRSDDAQKTALAAFPYALRFATFVTVSDSPLAFDRDRWRRVLAETSIEGRPLFDLTRARDRRRFDDLLALAGSMDAPPTLIGLESRESIAARTAGAVVVTDDNMACEWRWQR